MSSSNTNKTPVTRKIPGTVDRTKGGRAGNNVFSIAHVYSGGLSTTEKRRCEDSMTDDHYLENDFSMPDELEY